MLGGTTARDTRWINNLRVDNKVRNFRVRDKTRRNKMGRKSRRINNRERNDRWKDNVDRII